MEAVLAMLLSILKLEGYGNIFGLFAGLATVLFQRHVGFAWYRCEARSASLPFPQKAPEV